jgi:uncharacterized protein YuzE
MSDIAYDPEADAAYVTLSDAPVHESAEVSPGVVLDYDAKGRLVGIELLGARKLLAPGAWSRAPRGAAPNKRHAAE